MTTIPLDRRFYEWVDEPDAQVRSIHRQALRLQGDNLPWSDLLAKRRVVILAEAGSGKTEELKEQARLKSAAGKFAFYATVQEVARGGLEKALRVADRQRFCEWHKSADPAWFFIDSIDEAKLDNVRLEQALKEIASGIHGADGRAHIVLSGRHTDWEFARDVSRLKEELPIPDGSSKEPRLSLEELVRRVLRKEKRPDPEPAEVPLVVVMAPLDEDKVRAYAAAKEAPNLDALIAAIEAHNLWEFARRPLDLDWIVSYWRDHGRLGSLTEMIELSLVKRAREHDPDRARKDPLDQGRVRQALERIGASMVFGRQSAIAIPDGEVGDARGAWTPPLELEEVLPDWSSEDRVQLLTRPAFDPATFGRARLHNDNEGVVRAYLTARWLVRLRQANLPERRLHQLLFARTYGIDLVRPSLLETSAWLSLWDQSVAAEVIRRAPFLLLTAGDPGSLSLQMRKAALTALVERMRAGEETPFLAHSSLMRFAQSDLSPAVRVIWEANKEDQEIRQFMLRLIWVGKLRDCADIAEAASFGRYPDTYSAVLAGRALLALGDDRQLKAYVEYVKRDCASLSTTTVAWEAVEDLFPRLLSVDDLLEIVERVKLGDDDGGGFHLDWRGEELARRLSTADELTRLIQGLLRNLGEPPREFDPYDSDSLEAQYQSILCSAARKLLELSPSSDAPDAAIDALVRLGDHRFGYLQAVRQGVAEAVNLASLTSERRRAAFWRAAGSLANHPTLDGRPLLHFFQMRFLGWPGELKLEDVAWLLEDAPGRKLATERRLAIDAAMNLWSNDGDRDEGLKNRIAAVAEADGEMKTVVTEWMTPRVKSDSEIESERRSAEAVRAAESKQAERDQSWIDFVSEARSDPAALRQLRPTTPAGVDSRIFHLWQLLDQARPRNSRYAIDSVEPIEEIVGKEVASALASGLSKIWRDWTPTLRSARPQGQDNQISSVDCMCIAGVSIEAASDPKWASKLSRAEAVLAIRYATLEINGFPDWLAALVDAWPEPVEEVLAKEVASDLDKPSPGVPYQFLDFIQRSSKNLAALMWPCLWRELVARPDLNPKALRPMLPVLVHGLPDACKAEFYRLAIERFNDVADPDVSAQYLGAAYAVDAHGATDTLMSKLSLLEEAEGTALVLRTLPQIFGSRWHGPISVTSAIDLSTLERLVLLAYRRVRMEDDRDRSRKGAYSPDLRDHAEAARSAAFNALINTTGEAAFEAIKRLIANQFPISASRVNALALDRASNDAENTAWAAGEAANFEQSFERPPVTGRELQVAVLDRLEDLQHELIHGDYQQGKTLKALPNEPAVQNWMADRFQQLQGVAYTIEREPHVAGEKEPDIRFRARASSARVAMEIKVAESWSLSQLESALVKQLCGQYLRARDGREGILLLVHQDARAKGWEMSDGTFIGFDQVVLRLRAMAAEIRASDQDCPQPYVGVIDVSSCPAP